MSVINKRLKRLRQSQHTLRSFGFIHLYLLFHLLSWFETKGPRAVFGLESVAVVKYKDINPVVFFY